MGVDLDLESISEATSGAIGYLLSTTILYPLDTCKSKFQAEIRVRGQQKYRLLNKLSSPVLVLGSRVVETEEDESQLMSWESRLEDDMKMIQFQDNKDHIGEVLAANDI